MKNNPFTISTPHGLRKIGPNEPCFIIAEMSGNHNLKYEKAVEIIKAVAASGADAIKLQTYTADTMTIDSDKEYFVVKGKDNPDTWKGQKLYDLYKKAYTPWEWQGDLKKIAESLGLVFFSTPFDPTAVDFLETLNVPLYKIASYETTDYVLLKKVAATGKPIIMSVGFATEEEITFALETLYKYGAKDILLLHCVTAYSDRPSIEEMNLRTILDISERFGVLAGFSDNNAGIEIPITAAIMGAVAIEKHVIINRVEGGSDARFSVQPEELTEMVQAIRHVEKMKGIVHYGCQSEKEEQNRIFRRSLFVVAPIKKGEKFTPQNVRSIRPAHGLPTRYYDEVMGKIAITDIERGTPLSWDLVIQ